MKKTYYCILVLFLLAIEACNSEYEIYSGEDAIYFNEVSDTSHFSFTYIDSKYDRYVQEVHLKVIGQVVDYDRKVDIRFTSKNAKEGVDFEPFEDTYVVKAGEVAVVVPVTMIRTTALLTEERVIDMELFANDNFTTHYEIGSNDSITWIESPRLKFTLIFSEFMDQAPSQWNPYLFGDFTAKKFKLICDVMGIEREKFLDYEYMAYRSSYIARYMKQYLSEEKSAGRTIYEEDGVTEMTMGPYA